MKKYKNPALLQAYWNKAQSAEAKEENARLEGEYQQERKEHEEILHVQDKNFYQGLKDNIHVSSQEQAYLDYKEDRRLRLQDKYFSEGDKILEHYHPELFEQPREQKELNQEQTTETAQSLNNGYYLEQHAPKLALALRKNIGDISHREEPVQDFIKGQELSIEEKQAEFKENAKEIEMEVEQDLRIEIDNEPDLDVDDGNRKFDDIEQDKDISPDIDD